MTLQTKKTIQKVRQRFRWHGNWIKRTRYLHRITKYLCFYIVFTV